MLKLFFCRGVRRKTVLQTVSSASEASGRMAIRHALTPDTTLFPLIRLIFTEILISDDRDYWKFDEKSMNCGKNKIGDRENQYATISVP